MRFDEKPFLCIWEMTQACDLVCTHCRADARAERDPDELSTVEAKRMLSRLAAAGVPLVVFTGGDPAKREDLLELVDYGTKLGLSLGLTPSATPLVTMELLRELAAAGLRRLAVSLDGRTPQVHDGFRGRAGSFDRTLEILAAARAVGLSTQVNTTLHEGNLTHLPALAGDLCGLGIDLWSVFVMVPTGRATLAKMPTALEVEEALLTLAELAPRLPFAIKSTAGPQFRRIALQRKKAGAEVAPMGARGPQAMWVNEGRGLLFVSHRGVIYPSGFLPTPCGNVRRDDPVHVYGEHPLFQALRAPERLGGKCRACSYRAVCGGSRARAAAMSGDLFAADPLCPYVPPDYAGPVEVFDESARRRHRALRVLEPAE